MLKCSYFDITIPQPSKLLNSAEQSIDMPPISPEEIAANPNYSGAVGLNTLNTQNTLTFERLKQLHSSLSTCPAEDTRAKSPLGLKVDLMDHQLYALSWLNWRETQEPYGGILADDMGLGKTLSMISLVLENKENNVGQTQQVNKQRICLN